MPHVGVIFLMIDVCTVLKIIDIVKANQFDIFIRTLHGIDGREIDFN